MRSRRVARAFVAASALACLAAAGAMPVPARDAAAALRHLQEALLRQAGAPLDCVAILREDEGGDVASFVLLEVHDVRCGGDPATAPVRGRYRISAAGEVSVYDAAEDAYTALP